MYNFHASVFCRCTILATCSPLPRIFLQTGRSLFRKTFKLQKKTLPPFNPKMQITLVFLALIPVLVMSNADLISSPEPLPDPLSSGLFLVTAGRNPLIVAQIQEGMTVCPSDFPKGFSIMCRGGGRSASFFENGVLVRREYKAPFYIAGDQLGKVSKWNPLYGMITIRCRIRGGPGPFNSDIHISC